MMQSLLSGIFNDRKKHIMDVIRLTYSQLLVAIALRNYSTHSRSSPLQSGLSQAISSILTLFSSLLPLLLLRFPLVKVLCLGLLVAIEHESTKSVHRTP